MLFEHQIIDRLSKNSYLQKGISKYNGSPAIFPYYTPNHFNNNLPYINFFTEHYDVPTRGETKKLTILYHNNDIDFREFDKYNIEIINSIDNMMLNDDDNGQLRFYLANNPEIKTVPEVNMYYSEISFIIRGNLKEWGIL